MLATPRTLGGGVIAAKRSGTNPERTAVGVPPHGGAGPIVAPTSLPTTTGPTQGAIAHRSGAVTSGDCAFCSEAWSWIEEYWWLLLIGVFVLILLVAAG